MNLVAGSFHVLCAEVADDPLLWAKKLIENEEAGEVLSYYQRELAYSALGLPVPKKEPVNAAPGR